MWCFKKREKDMDVEIKKYLLSSVKTLISDNIRLMEMVFEKMLWGKYLLWFNEWIFYVTEKDKKWDFIIRWVLWKLIYQTTSTHELNWFTEWLKFLSSKIYKWKNSHSK